MENVASYSFKSSDRHKISFFNDGGLKLDHIDTFDMLSRSRDGLAVKGLFGN